MQGGAESAAWLASGFVTEQAKHSKRLTELTAYCHCILIVRVNENYNMKSTTSCTTNRKVILTTISHNNEIVT
jgi:hypothetical protein